MAIVLFCMNGELLQALQGHMPKGEEHASPLLGLLFCHLGGLVLAPHFAGIDAEFEPPSDIRGLLGGNGGGVKGFLATRPRITALIFALFLMGYNYAWLLSTRFLPVASTNALFQTSVGLVYALSVCLFGEALTSPRVAGVVLAIAGSLLASGIFAGSMPGTATSHVFKSAPGVGLALTAAVGVAIYQVLFRFIFEHLKQQPRFIAFFSAWIGIWHVLVVLPLIVMADFAGIETMQLPRGFHALLGTGISALLASAVNVLYLCIALWGSPMLLPCTSILIVPLSVLLDLMIHRSFPTLIELLGHVSVVVAVMLILNLKEAVPHALMAARLAGARDGEAAIDDSEGCAISVRAA